MALATVPNDELRLRLGVKPGQKVCLFRAPKHLLPLFLTGDLQLTLDWVESDADVIVYWLQPQDDVVGIMVNLERMIKRNGRIWLFVSQPETDRQQDYAEHWEAVKQAVLEATALIENKVLFLSNSECGTQFMPKKAVREKTGAEGASEPCD